MVQLCVQDLQLTTERLTDVPTATTCWVTQHAALALSGPPCRPLSFNLYQASVAPAVQSMMSSFLSGMLKVGKTAGPAVARTVRTATPRPRMATTVSAVMTKKDLVAAVAEKSGLEQKQARGRQHVSTLSVTAVDRQGDDLRRSNL